MDILERASSYQNTEKISEQKHIVSGSEVIAEVIRKLEEQGAVTMGVPGTPTTDIVEYLQKHGSQEEYWVEMDEVDMMRQLVGINALGRTTIAVMKHTGFSCIQEQLVVLSNLDLRAPLVLIVGDEPGATSQMGNDTRSMCDSSYIPVVEPSFNNIEECFSYCLQLSDRLRKPVVYRVVPRSVAHCGVAKKISITGSLYANHTFSNRDYYASEDMVIGRYTSTKTLLNNLKLEKFPEINSFMQAELKTGNEIKALVISAGGIADRVKVIIKGGYSFLSHLEINTVSHLPETILAELVPNYDAILVMESWEPYLERRIRDFVQRMSGANHIIVYGREPQIEVNANEDELIMGAGDMSDTETENVINVFLSGGTAQDITTTYQSRCGDHSFSSNVDSRFLNIFEAFTDASKAINKSPVFSLSTGRTRYSVMDTQYEQYVQFMSPMGSEALTLIGYLKYVENISSISPCLIIGDYTFAHSSWKGVSALNLHRARTGVVVPVIVIENGGSKTTGGQLNHSLPADIGRLLVTNWGHRFLGTVSIDDKRLLRSNIEMLMDPATEEDILIVRALDC